MAVNDWNMIFSWNLWWFVGKFIGWVNGINWTRKGICVTGWMKENENVVQDRNGNGDLGTDKLEMLAAKRKHARSCRPSPARIVAINEPSGASLWANWRVLVTSYTRPTFDIWWSSRHYIDYRLRLFVGLRPGTFLALHGSDRFHFSSRSVSPGRLHHNVWTTCLMSHLIGSCLDVSLRFRLMNKSSSVMMGFSWKYAANDWTA